MNHATGRFAGAQIEAESSSRAPRYLAIIPALNEAECIGRVVAQLLALKRRDGSLALAGVFVGDNGSTDATCVVAQAAGATVATTCSRGYGHGCMAAIAAARPTLASDVYVFVDGDDTLNYAEIESLLTAIECGAALVIGRRIHRARHSMSFAQRFGNALCCALIRVLWRADVNDLGPLRAIRADHFAALDMQALTYGWTLEMQIKVHEQRLPIVEIPVSTLVRASGSSKVSSNLRAAARCGRVMLRTIFELWRTRGSRVTQPDNALALGRTVGARPPPLATLDPTLKLFSSHPVNKEPSP